MDSIALQQARTANTYVNRGLCLTHGAGAYLVSENGDRYLDLMSNYGVSVFGYGHPTLTATLSHQISTLTTLHNSFSNTTRAEASDALVKRCGADYHQVYWSNSGAEAIEAALKFAVLTTKKKRFIVCDHGYHGKTLGALSATAGEKYKAPFQPLLWDFVQIPFNNLAALEQALNDQTAAFIVEPIQGEGGIHPPTTGYLTRVKELCAAKGALLILDEIQTGIGRTGTFLASHKEQVIGDIVCLGKGLAGGIPVGATVFNQRIADTITKHIHTSTFGGNPLACAGVLVTLSLLTDSQLERVKTLEAEFKTWQARLASPLLSDTRGEGLMLGFVVKDKRNELLKALQNEHVLAIPAGEDVIRLLPPFILTDEDMAFGFNAFQNALKTFS